MGEHGTLLPRARPSLFLSLAVCRVQLPFSQSGVTIERDSNFLKVTARLGLVFLWNQDDSLLVSRAGG